MRTLWVCAATGGPYTYVPTKPGSTPLGLENAHCELRITSSEFDEVARELQSAMNDFNVPHQEQTEVLNAFSAHKREVIAGSIQGCPVTSVKSR